MNLLAEFELLKNMDERTLLGWTTVFSALAMVGVVYIVWNMYKIARNQVKLSIMIDELLKRR